MHVTQSTELFSVFFSLLSKLPIFEQCEDLMGTIFVSLSMRNSKQNRYMELPVYEYIDERRGSDQKLQFTVLQGKVFFLQISHSYL